jgi:hypothetical protein
MHGVHDYLAGLSRLAELSSDEERRSAWRQGLAALAAAANQHPTPLEGLDVEGLRAGARVALASGLVDDLAWLSKPMAATALFELGAALPQGREKRDIGRRVLTALHEGDASTFVSVARSLALGSRRALSGAPVRARVALALQLPIGDDAGVDALALALISRPELEEEWLSGPSTGSLPARRLAARLLERAARETAQRAAEGDGAAVRVFARPSVRAAWARLLADRESLVWRHVAMARGLLLPAAPELGEEIDRGLLPRTGVGEWRRAAASLAATIASEPERALGRCRELLGGEIVKRDPLIRVALMYGLSRACEEEPEAAGELLQLLLRTGELDVLEALTELRRHQVGSDFTVRAAETALQRLHALRPASDDGLVALRAAIEGELEAELSPPVLPTLPQELAVALRHFAEGRPLAPAAEAALGAARRLVADLEAAGDDTPVERRRAFAALRDLDTGLLESSVFSDLLAVCGPAAGAAAGELSDLLARVHEWLCKREAAPLGSPELPHPTLRMRRLRTLLHVLDGEEAPADDAGSPARQRRMRAFRLLLRRVEADPPSPLRRITCAALARACDAVVRDETCELSDLFIVLASTVRGAEELRVLAEASMVPELKEALRAGAEVARLSTAKTERALLDAFQALAQALPLGASPRVEALRQALGGMARALRRVEGARSLEGLRQGNEGSVLEQLGEAAHYGARLCASAWKRMGLPEPAGAPSVGAAVRALDTAVDRAARDVDDALPAALRAVDTAARADLPEIVAVVLSRVLARVTKLPAESPGGEGADVAQVPAADRRLPLPGWLPPSRVIGGFYVLRAIGSGGGGSVFVARRAEERHDDGAETYALKVPSYGGQNAHTLTEDEFLRLFREEAGALLTLPAHQNLAGFVTFDARARPKPILAMELVQGPTLERVLDKRELSTSLAFAMLDGVAAGLGAMHGAGVGHLDVKPSNVILRMPAGGGSSSRLVPIEALRPMPVLVDFGLAGRKIRPGCASPYYGAPEVWDTSPDAGSDPMPADVYAFSCLAYELLTGQTLFLADTLPGLIACHLNHDGNPPGLARLRADAQLAPLAEVLTAGLQPDPRHRASIGEVGQALQEIARSLDVTGWPLAA